MSAAPVYPPPRPADTNNRFSLGLALDIAAVLTRHGYPPITASADLIRLHQAISGLIYQHNNASDQPLDIPSSIGNQIPPTRLPWKLAPSGGQPVLKTGPGNVSRGFDSSSFRSRAASMDGYAPGSYPGERGSSPRRPTRFPWQVRVRIPSGRRTRAASMDGYAPDF